MKNTGQGFIYTSSTAITNAIPAQVRATVQGWLLKGVFNMRVTYADGEVVDIPMDDLHDNLFSFAEKVFAAVYNRIDEFFGADFQSVDFNKVAEKVRHLNTARLSALHSPSGNPPTL